MDATARWSRIGKPLLELGLGLGLLGAGLFGVILPLLGVAGTFDPGYSRQIAIDGAARPPAAAVLHGAVVLAGTHQARITFADPDLRQRLLVVLPGIAGSLLLMLILELLLGITRTLHGDDGGVFAPRNARRLGVIAAAVAAMAVLGPGLTAITTHLLVRGTPVADRVPLSWNVSGGYFLLALLVAAVGEVFRRGTRLRAETEGQV